MNTARIIEILVVGIYRLSPYTWIDGLLQRAERRTGPGQYKTWRYHVSGTYINTWFVLSVLAWSGHDLLPAWCIWPAMLRVVGILNKEIGVVLFGRCKITPGRKVAATGRTIVLALENYTSAAFLMAFVYTKAGHFAIPTGAADGLASGQALIQALSIQFAMNPAFPPVDQISWSLVMFQTGFAFLFSLIVISLFVSLLEFGASSN